MFFINLSERALSGAYNSTDDRIKLKANDMLMKHLGGYVNDFTLIQKLDDSDLERLADKLIRVCP